MRLRKVYNRRAISLARRGDFGGERGIRVGFEQEDVFGFRPCLAISG